MTDKKQDAGAVERWGDVRGVGALRDNMVLLPQGEYVKYSDYAALLAEREAAEQLAAELREELASVLESWNAVRKASGSPTNGGLAGHVAELRQRAEAAEGDARRWDYARDHLFRMAPGPNMGGLHRYCPTPDIHYLRGPTLEQAIDARIAAIAHQAQEGGE